ncbi:hypothetical protein CRG98_013768 [Punica granatum]|uniref:Uncharacterized protein n=1 Tax=Punica granatum TaxID=22663 RepID=A0A2I0KBE1_PUNGR|nr:hypothetical protein CRG98_013768 [Punica granatum]
MQPPYGTMMIRVLSSRARRTTDRAAWAPLRMSRYAHARLTGAPGASRSTLELESLIARPGHPQRSSRLSARSVLDKSKTSGLRMTPSSNKHLGHTTIRKP